MGYFQELSNWGRWGSADRAGTLNHLTPERTAAAASRIRSGETVGLARPVGISRSTGPNYLHYMTASGEAAPPAGASTAGDWFGMECHGFDITHLDAHAHFFWDGQMYNGRDASQCTTERGAVFGGIEPWFDGIAGRGVLVDGPEIRGKAWLEPGEGLGPADLDRWFDEHGLSPEPGDLLFVRTGRDRWEAEGAQADAGTANCPGLDASCLPWLAARQVAVVAGDCTNDALPSGIDTLGMFGPIHAVGLVSMGLWLIDNAALGQLTGRCQKEGRFDFFVSVGPVPLRRVTGVPVNPIAVF